MLSINPEEASRRLKSTMITVLPDFYLDVIINPNMNYNKLIEEIDVVYQRGGGNVLGLEVDFVFGGNGGNVAKSLGGLGIKTAFITRTSTMGKLLVEHFLHPLGIETCIDETGKMASSIIFEISENSRKKNVMMSSSGSVVDFSADVLTEEQWEILKRSQIVAITNAQNYTLEELAETLLEELPPSIQISIDFSDLIPHSERIYGFQDRILNHPIRPPTFIVGNENEIITLAQNKNKDPSLAAKQISTSYPDTIFGLHTTTQSELWHKGERKAIAPSYKIDVLRATGAGDAWHAGLLVGRIIELSMENSLKLANATAAYQISSGRVGNLQSVLDFAHSSDMYILTK